MEEQNSWLEWPQLLKGVSSLLVTTHINPDPDALASGLGVLTLVKHLSPEIEATFAFSGIVGREENRALVELCNIPLRPWAEINPERFDLVVLVDCQFPQGNHPLISPPHITLDHHPKRPSEQLSHSDIRPYLGATSTLVYLYLKNYNISLSSKVATALLYGIKTDTADLLRSEWPDEWEIYLELIPQADRELLLAIQEAPVSRRFFAAVREALERAELWRGDILITALENLAYPEFPAQMADFLSRSEGVHWTIVMGFYEATLYLSVRSQKGLDAGKMVQQALQHMGRAGGHGRAAGGQVPLIDEESKEALLKRVYQAFARTLGVPLEREAIPFLPSHSED